MPRSGTLPSAPLLVLTALLLGVACGDTEPGSGEPRPDGGTGPEGGTGPDAGVSQDAGVDAAAADVLLDGATRDGPAAHDAAPGDAPGADGGAPSACGESGAPACLSNDDCGAGLVCRSFSAVLEDRCCVTGTRGPGAAGAPCVSDAECAFGRCFVRDDGLGFCSGGCSSDLECPGAMFCSDIFHWCVPRDSTAPPQSCDELGLAQCFYNDNCAAAERCENFGGTTAELLCCTAGPRGVEPVGAACATELECAFGRCLGGRCSESCEIDDDPCPPATMECNLIRGLCEPL